MLGRSHGDLESKPVHQRDTKNNGPKNNEENKENKTQGWEGVIVITHRTDLQGLKLYGHHWGKAVDLIEFNKSTALL